MICLGEVNLFKKKGAKVAFFIITAVVVFVVLVVGTSIYNENNVKETIAAESSTQAMTQPLTNVKQPEANAQPEFNIEKITHEVNKEDNFAVKNIKGDNYIVFYPEILIDAVDKRIKTDIDYFKSRCEESNSKYLSVDYSVYKSEKNLLSLVYTITSYNDTGKEIEKDIFTRVFNAATGKELSQNDIFDVDFFDYASQIVRENLIASIDKSIYNISLDSFISKTNNDALNYDRFAFDKARLIIYFDSYSLFDKGAEVFEVDFLNEEINDYFLIDDNGKRKPTEGNIPLYVNDDSRIDPNKPMVAITFDDGPSSKNTREILNTLNQNNSRATFFVCGYTAVDNTDVLQEINSAGNQIGNHTMNHADLTQQSADDMKNAVESVNDIVEGATGKRPRIVRPPYGAVNHDVKAILSDYAFILWDIDTQDWLIKDSQKIYRHIIDNVADGSIVLLHDIHEETVQAVEMFVPKLVEMGYQLVTVDELFYYKDAQMMPGESYLNIV